MKIKQTLLFAIKVLEYRLNNSTQGEVTKTQGSYQLFSGDKILDAMEGVF
jgi:hypothetical protein